MIVELHVIQNFAPSNLNRSDTGTPKDCEFGGHRRARVSSQCFKRAVRDHFDATLDKSPSVFALRSKRIQTTLAEIFSPENSGGNETPRSQRIYAKLSELVKEKKVDTQDLDYRIEALLAACGIFLVEEQKQVVDEEGNENNVWIGESETLAFLGEDSVEDVVKIIIENPEAVSKAGDIFKTYREEKRKGDKYKGNVAKDDKKKLAGKVKMALGKDIAGKLEKALDGSKAADLALFGRMLADLPEKNVDAACQVAHAISTHKVGTEFDFYTAVDDLLPKDETGAAMMGTLEFNSACFYRYANVDLKQLKENLKDDDLEKATLKAFISAFVEAIPTGKQNGHAAHQKPSFVMAVVREAGMLNLANAFVKPVFARENEDLVEKSIKELVSEWVEMTEMYGNQGQHFFIHREAKIEPLGERVKCEKEEEKSLLDALVARVMTASQPKQGGN